MILFTKGNVWFMTVAINNKIVVDLIESKRPVGVMAILDDVCVQLHAVVDGVCDHGC